MGLKVIYPAYPLKKPQRTIAYQLAEDIKQQKTSKLYEKYQKLKAEEFPDNIFDIYWLERFYFGQKQYQISNQLADIMVEVLPDDWEVYDIKGQNLEQLGKKGKALKFYKKAFKLNPKSEQLKAKIKRLK